MGGQRITVLGECVADAFTDRARTAGSGTAALSLRVLPGGGPANTAVALARLGTPSRFLGRLSGDVFGRLFRDRLLDSGVDLSGCVAAPEPSTLAVADVDPDGRASYAFFAEGAADWQWTAGELAAAPLDGTVCLHTGSLALVREPGGRRVEEFLAPVRERATVCVDPNVRPLLVPPSAYRERIGRWCALADILRLSEDDLALLLPGTSPEDACDRWHGAGARLVVVTLGPRGALASLDGVRVTVPAPPTEVADTVGAGDSFTAGLLHALAGLGRLGGRLHGLTPNETAASCAYAALVAARTCAVPGADPPWAADLPQPPRPGG
ncbi:carbohydrate kinase [Streptomyces somaliensis DSM 40738]|uniref:Carbohydrate kinase n=1 Tax=Streptomyces somaliensis (strain ATCC 33201 / DSM 40738 / JCM 12659 / KCTC 9044 / NCTC 11332 / NRRL B-12077 / IP 733) TaxID=1134445 RepID=A0AA44DD99_STRE0|nr:carbohydrate kinase [Streptomyces somaliensis]MCQ0025192.1 carbohydrate kinase [Streptomyces somaliensis DSM 40738]NKY14627.1 carbohydrate kinase [Streptomyces somaliensis DSM 40738]